MDSNQSHQIQELYNSNNKQFKQIEKLKCLDTFSDKKLNRQKKGKNSKYFLGIEKSNYVNKLVTKIEIEGKEIISTCEISDAQTKYYQNLYSEKLNRTSQNYSNSINEFWINNDMSKPDSEQKDFCD